MKTRSYFSARVDRRSSLDAARSAALAVLLPLLLTACGGARDRSAEAPPAAQSSALRVGAPGAARWSSKIEMTIVPASAANLPNGKVLLWSSESRLDFGGAGQTYTAIFDPITSSVAEHLVSATGHDMFCPGTTNLEDGRVLVNGGVNSGKTSLYDPATNTWSAGATMKITRGYNANTILADGSVLTLGGSWSGGRGNKHAEVWTASGGWRRLNGVPVTSMMTADPEGPYRADNHMWLIPTGDGRVLHAGPSVNMHWIDTRGDGSIVSAGTRGDDTDSMSGNAVMYDAGKILKVGGSTAYSNVEATNSAYVIDVNRGLTVRKLTPMAYARAFHNSVVLPNGQVVVIGGQTRPVPFSDNRAVLVPELWDPVTEAFTPLTPMTIPRTYHSVALLLADGRVMAAGGGLCGTCSTNHPDAEILTPPYLLNADGTPAARPVILSAPSVVNYGAAASVTTDGPVSAFALVRLGSTTHTVNNDQRRLPLAFQSTGPGAYTVSIPTNPGLALPGAYMLFALDADGVPSLSKLVRVTGSQTPRLTSPGDQVGTVAVAASLALVATRPDPEGGLTFSATGLPPGLSLNAATGLITGAPTLVGTYAVTVFATNPAGAVSTDFVWKILPAGSARFVRLEQLSEVNGGNAAAMAEFHLLDPDGAPLGRSSWTVNADSSETAAAAHPAGHAVDGDDSTFWHTQWTGGSPPPPHHFTVDLGQVVALGGFRYLPRQDDSSTGTIAEYRLYISHDGVQWGAPVASGILGAAGVSTASTVLFASANNGLPLVTTPGAQSTPQGGAVSLAIVASDPDGDALSYAATGLPSGLQIDATTGVIGGTATVAGIFDVVVTAQDATASSAAAFSWTVVAPTPPIAPVVAPPATGGTVVTYNAQATGTALTYAWDFGDGSARTPFDDSAAATHTFAAPGLYTVTVFVQTPDEQITSRSFTQAIVAPALPGRAATSSNLAVEPRAQGDRLWVVNPDSDSVSVFDSATHGKLAEIPVGGAPATVAIAPNGAVWVTNRDGASISVVNPATLAVTGTLALPRASRPFGLVFAADGTAYVALEATGRLLKLNAAGAVVGELAVGPSPRYLSIDAAGAHLLVSRFITPPLPGEATAAVQTVVGGQQRGGEIVVVETATLTTEALVVLRHSDASDSTTQGRGVPNYLGAAVIAPDGASAWVPSKQDNVKRGSLRDGLNLDFQNSVRAITSRIDLTTLAEDHPARVDHDNSGVASAAAFHPSGAYLFVALETSRQVAIIDPVGRREILRVDAGRAPQGVAVDASGLRLYVSNFMDRTVSVFDLVPLVNNGEARLPLVTTLSTASAERLSPQVLTGKRLFYDARDGRLARDGYLSCASCHRDGEEDGRTWDLTGFGEGLRNTISLRGRQGGQGRLHWSGNFDEVQDFEAQIRALSQGSGLMSDADLSQGTRSAPLGDAKTGVSADLDALAAYVRSLDRFLPSPHRTSGGALTSAAAAGRQLFVGACAHCHGGAAFTHSAGTRLDDVGTIKPSSGQRLGGPLLGLDAPTLRDVWATPPYLHDGSAATVADAIRAHAGVTLGDAAVAQVAEFVQQIGSEEVAMARAVRARFVKLEQLTEVQGRPWGSMAEFNLLDATGATLSRAGWTAAADSVETAGENGAAANVLDGNPESIWHTQWQDANPAPPHFLVVDLKTPTSLGGFRYLPRQTGPVNGTFAHFRFFISDDGATWGPAVAEGDFATMGAARAAKTVVLE